MDGEQKEEPWLVPYEEIVESMRLSMASAGIPSETIEDVLATLQDYAVNNLGDD